MRTDPTWVRTLIALTAVTLTGLPTSVAESQAETAPALLVALQDTTRARRDTVRAIQDTTRARARRLEPEEEVRDVRRRADSDSLAADSLEAQGEPFPDPDSIMQALLSRPGYSPVVYRGDTLQFTVKDRSIHIIRRANIERGGDNLQSSDSVIYRGDDKFVVGYGNSKLLNAKGEEVTSEEGPLYYHTERKIGTVVGGKTQWEAWAVEGNFTLEGTDTLWVRSGHFTTCDLPEPHYRFESNRIKLVLGNIVVAWPVRLYFGDVPVFWFPFMAQDIRSGRHSGLLALRFGFNDIVRNSSNYSRHLSNIGYYWAISDYMDAQLSMDWWSGNWTRFDGFYRYRWRERFLDGRLGYSHFLLPDGREISASWDHSQKFGERTDLRASLYYVSSQQFNREAEFNPERLTQQIRSNIGFTRRFDWGALNVSGQRVQPITDREATTMTLPQLSLTLSPIALTPARSPLEKRWYNGLTWTGSTSFNQQFTDNPLIVTSRLEVDSTGVGDSLVVDSTLVSDSTKVPNQVTRGGGLNSNLTLGNLSWNSTGSVTDQTVEAPDTSVVTSGVSDPALRVVFGPRIRATTISWRSSVGYRQRLIGSTALTPALEFDGSYFRSYRTQYRFVRAPTRLSVRASLNSDVYGFFPGVGPYERIRHKLSPGLSWAYSPEVQPNPELEGIPGVPQATSKERHQLTLTLAQTFEAKLKPRKELEDSIRATADSAGAPEQQPEARKLTLLAIRTSALAYDFVEERLTTERLSNTLTSDLLRGLTVRVDHDLFDEQRGRAFDPFLTQLNLTFSLGDRAVAGLFGQAEGIASGRGIIPETRSFEEEDFLVDSLRAAEEERQRPSGEGKPSRPWNLSLDYSLLRNRPVVGDEAPAGRNDRQSVRLNLSFSPTDNWTVAWRTQYDLEDSRFVDQTIVLRRDLHRWAATFEFLKSANGNLVFNFRVNLNDLRDVKFDYRQETR